MCYAKSIGQLMRTAKDTSKEKLFGKLKTWYMDKEDDVSRAAVAYTFQGINRYSPDVMKGFANIAMPIAFLAMHEEKGPEGSNSLQGNIEMKLESRLSFLLDPTRNKPVFGWRVI